MDKNNDGIELLKPIPAFALLKLSKSRGYEAIQRGEIPIVKIGNLTRIPRKWIEAQVQTAMAACESESAEG